MALTSIEERDLLIPLFEGANENPRFSVFLERLCRRSGAEYVGLVLRWDESPQAPAEEYQARPGFLPRAAVTTGHTGEANERFPHDWPYDWLRPGRIYSLSELADHDRMALAGRTARLRRTGLADERVVRIGDAGGFMAWMIIARARACTAADGALLSNLTPYVAATLRALAARERLHGRATAGMQALARAGLSWIAFDREARLLDLDPGIEEWLRDRTGTTPRRGERLRGLDAPAGQRLAEAIAALGEGMADAPRAIPLILWENPRLEALMTPSDAFATPAILALCRLPHCAADESAALLARLFGLAPREAELAIALSEGHSIAEAGEAMGLTLETARNYSKQLYAKLGVRGQTQLVRLVLESAALLA